MTLPSDMAVSVLGYLHQYFDLPPSDVSLDITRWYARPPHYWQVEVLIAGAIYVWVEVGP